VCPRTAAAGDWVAVDVAVVGVLMYRPPGRFVRKHAVPWCCRLGPELTYARRHGGVRQGLGRGWMITTGQIGWMNQ